MSNEFWGWKKLFYIVVGWKKLSRLSNYWLLLLLLLLNFTQKQMNNKSRPEQTINNP